jgi:protein-tyrosine phosphatase
MAEVIARREIGEQGYAGIEVESAGVSAEAGAGATEDAMRVAKKHNLDLSGHRSRQLTPELLASVDLVVGMEQDHVEEAMRMGAREAITIGDEPVSDPFGGGSAAYLETWEVLERLIPLLLAAQTPRSP